MQSTKLQKNHSGAIFWKYAKCQTAKNCAALFTWSCHQTNRCPDPLSGTAARRTDFDGTIGQCAVSERNLAWTTVRPARFLDFCMMAGRVVFSETDVGFFHKRTRKKTAKLKKKLWHTRRKSYLHEQQLTRQKWNVNQAISLSSFCSTSLPSPNPTPHWPAEGYRGRRM